MSEFSFHEKKITDAINKDPDRGERQRAHKRAYITKKPLQLPLVHRTADPVKANTLNSILQDGCLRPRESPSHREVELSLKPAVYFFYGSGAYPNGRVGLVFHPETAEQANSAFSAFDSGALASPYYLEPTFDDPEWSNPRVREEFLAEHTGDCADLNKFAMHYLNAHFLDIKDYVRRPLHSDPDWPPYHGLKCNKGLDRRAWTIETRLLDQVSAKQLHAVFLDRTNWLFRPGLNDEVFGDTWPEIILVEEFSGEPQPDDVPDRLEAAIANFIIDEYFPGI